MLQFLSRQAPKPETIFFARDIQEGQLQSCTVITQWRKFRLARNTDGTYYLRSENDRLFTVKRESMLVSREPRPNTTYPYDCWTIVPIGSTRLDKAGLEAAFKELSAPYLNPRRLSRGKLSWAQGQHLLRDFVQRILDQPDRYLAWCYQHLEGHRQTAERLPRPDRDMPLVYHPSHAPWIEDQAVAYHMWRMNDRAAEFDRVQVQMFPLAGGNLTSVQIDAVNSYLDSQQGAVLALGRSYA